MKKWTMMVVLALFAGMVQAVDLNQWQGLKYDVVTTITTNEKTSESEYNERTNGFQWVESHQKWSGVTLFAIDGLSVTNVLASGTFAWFSVNQNTIDAPDPFQEKVTVTRFLVFSNDLYRLRVGPLVNDYATIHTVIKRWQTRFTQKISMHEKTEKVEE